MMRWHGLSYTLPVDFSMGSKTMYLYNPDTMPSGSCRRPACTGSSSRRATSFLKATISSSRSACTTPSAAVGLAVVAVQAGVLEQVRVAGDEHAALAGGDRLGGVERVRAGVAPRAGAAASP